MSFVINDIINKGGGSLFGNTKCQLKTFITLTIILSCTTVGLAISTGICFGT